MYLCNYELILIHSFTPKVVFKPETYLQKNSGEEGLPSQMYNRIYETFR
jgi:hypothetical protein